MAAQPAPQRQPQYKSWQVERAQPQPQPATGRSSRRWKVTAQEITIPGQQQQPELQPQQEQKQGTQQQEAQAAQEQEQ